MESYQQLEQRRQQQLGTLARFGFDVESFGVEELDKLWRAGYGTLKRLQASTREGLKKAGLVPRAVDDILYAKGAAAGLGSAAGAGGGGGAGGVATATGTVAGLAMTEVAEAMEAMKEAMKEAVEAAKEAMKVRPAQQEAGGDSSKSAGSSSDSRTSSPDSGSSGGEHFDSDEGLLEAAQDNYFAQAFMSVLRQPAVYQGVLKQNAPPTSFQPPSREELIESFGAFLLKAKLQADQRQ